MIVDVHDHYIPKNLSDFMGDRFLPRVGMPVKTGIARHPVSDFPDDISGRFELMDAAGVGKQVLSPTGRPICPTRRNASEPCSCSTTATPTSPTARAQPKVRRFSARRESVSER